jgi:Flp pilus assembly pilin Flp
MRYTHKETQTDLVEYILLVALIAAGLMTMLLVLGFGV